MIVRNTPKVNFTILRNTVLERRDLSLKAKGLWAFLMSKPDGWQTTVRGLQSQLQEGRDAVTTALKELEGAGLYKKVGNRRPDGTFYYEDFVYDCAEEPRPENPYPVNQRPENPPQVSTDRARTDEVSTEKNTDVLAVAEETTYGKPEINDLFAHWEEAVGYPISGRRQANRNACNNLIKKHGADAVRRFINGVAIAQTDQYAPRIADFCGLQADLSKLLAWGKQKGARYAVAQF